MRRPTLAVVTSILLGFILAACDGMDETEPAPQEDEFSYMGTSPDCRREPEKALTFPIHTITVEDDSVIVEPHPLVQPPGPAGMIAWHSPTHDWRVTYMGGSPLPDTVYEGPGDGSLVFDAVRDDARCRAYTYRVEAWSRTEGQRAAPDTMTGTYPAAAADTVNGDEIQPFIFRSR